MWSKVAVRDACTDEYTFSMPWSSHAHCGFSKVVTYSTMTYSAVAEFTYIEASDDTATPTLRTLSNLFNFNIQLARQKDVQAAISLQFDAATDASVTAVIAGTSSYDHITGKTRVLIQTQTSWPYKIASPLGLPYSTGPQVASKPSTDIVVTIEPDYLSMNNCPTTANSVCIQQFEVLISASTSLSEPLCSFEGTYTFSTELICSDVDTCTPTTGPVIEIELAPTDVCSAPVVDTSATAQMTLVSFKDAAFGTPTTAFETGDTTYWSFAVVDPNVSIDTLTLNTVKLSLVTPDTGVDVIYEKGATAGDSPITNKIVSLTQVTTGVISPGSKGVVTFGLKLNRVNLPNTVGQLLVGAAIKQMELEVVIDIGYHGNMKRSVTGVASLNDGKVSNVATFVVKSRAEKPEALSAVSSNGWSFMGVSISKNTCTGPSYACAVASLVQKVLGTVVPEF